MRKVSQSLKAVGYSSPSCLMLSPHLSSRSLALATTSAPFCILCFSHKILTAPRDTSTGGCLAANALCNTRAVEASEKGGCERSYRTAPVVAQQSVTNAAYGHLADQLHKRKHLTQNCKHEVLCGHGFLQVFMLMQRLVPCC